MQQHLTRAVATPAQADAAAADARCTAHDGERVSAGERMNLSSVTLVAVTPVVVRAWAKENGWEVGVRGRLLKPLLGAYAPARVQRSPPLHIPRVPARTTA